MMSLKILCCKVIAKYGSVEILQPIADILPIDIVGHLLTLFDNIQSKEFHAICPKAAIVERKLIEKYKKLYIELEEPYDKTWHECQKHCELQYCYGKYWAYEVSGCLLIDNDSSRSRLIQINRDVQHHVESFDFTFSPLKDATFEIISSFTNIRCISLLVCTDTNLQNIFALAKNLRFLEKLKLLEFQDHHDLLLRLKQFLQFKVHKNERIALDFTEFRFGETQKRLSNLFTYLGGAIHGISGLAFSYGSRYRTESHSEALTAYSKVECIKKIKLRRANGVKNCLLNIISDAPPCTNEDHMLSMLRLEYVKLSKSTFTAFSHWRFSRLNHFHLSHVHIGHDGARLLAKYATFWPFLKRFILHDCQIPSKGFLLLLPAMVRGKGCENLVQLDFGENKCLVASMKTIRVFLSSTNLTKLKILQLFQVVDNSPFHSLSLWTTMQQLFLTRLDMSGIHLQLDQVYDLLYLLLSKENSPILTIKVSIQKCSTERSKQYWVNFTLRLKNSEISHLLNSQNEPKLQNRMHIHRSDPFSSFKLT